MGLIIHACNVAINMLNNIINIKMCDNGNDLPEHTCVRLGTDKLTAIIHKMYEHLKR